MSNFPFPWWDKTITIYNKYVNPTTQKVSWYRSVVKECFWKYVNDTHTIKGQMITLETKGIICRIPENKKYIKKSAWDILTDKSSRFTLATGDIIVLGEVIDVIDEYTSGQRSTDLITKYKKDGECLEIDSCTDNIQTGVALPHYKVVGK